MKINLLFVSLYPNWKQNIEGFIQRVKEIDNLFSDCERVYLEIFFFSNFTKNIYKSNKVTVYTLNWLFHFFLILKLLRNSNRIYIHSVYSGFRIFPQIFFSGINKAKVCLELHGTFQEELEYKGEKWNSKFFGWIEKMLLKKSRIVVFVSKKFEDYYLKKYPFVNKLKRFIIPTCSSKVLENTSNLNPKGLMEKYNITNDDVVFIYSGSIEIWQKIDLMMSIIKQLLQRSTKYKFFLLTANPNKMEKIAREFKIIPNERVFIQSVSPEDLANYYEISHYGFVLRDDHILNEVASPTKFLEYLFFGIIPILKSTKIGDFTNYDIDFITIDNLEREFKPTKSHKNILVAKKIVQEYKATLQMLKEEVLSDIK